MIFENHKLPAGAAGVLPAFIRSLKDSPEVVAFYCIGGLATGRINPLSDFDFAVLLSTELDKTERFESSLRILAAMNDLFRTEAIDLAVLNEAPPRFSHNVMKTGKLMYCRDRTALIAFWEHTTRVFLDFKPLRDDFNRTFLEGIGYHG